MKLLFILTLLFSSLQSFTQTLEELNDEYNKLYQKGEFEKAVPVAQKIVEEYKKSVGEKHSYYSLSLCNLANLYAETGQYEKAGQLFLQSIAIQKEMAGTENSDYVFVLESLASLYSDMGQYEKAEPLYLQGLAIQKNLVGAFHPDYAACLLSLAIVYRHTGQYEKSKTLLLSVLEISKKVSGERSQAYAEGLNSLALVYQNLGEYEKAEPLFFLSKEIKKQIWGEHHIQFAVSLNNLASLYEILGQYEKAEPLLLRAAGIWKNNMGAVHPEYANCLNGLAGLYENMQRYTEAESYYKEAKEVWKKSLGQMHWKYGICLNNLAFLYVKQGLYPKAEPLLIEAMDILMKGLGKEHDSFGTTVSNLSLLYDRTGSYERALELRIKAGTIWEKKLGATHPDYAKSLNYQALLYTTLHHPEKALPVFLTASTITSQNTMQLLPILSEKEKCNYINNNISAINSGNSFLYKFPGEFRKLSQTNYELLLLYKSLALSDTKTILTALRNTADSSIKRLLVQWQDNKSVLSREYSLPILNRRPGLKLLEEETEEQEKKINSILSLSGRQQIGVQLKAEAVQKNLGINEVAIEFVRFQLYDRKWTDRIIYGAYILKKNDSIPVFVPLCEERKLQQVFDSAGNSSASMAHKFYRGLEGKAHSTPTLGKELYQLLWQPLEGYLEGVKKISYSPAGKLYSIAFHALPVDSTMVLMDRYQLQQYTSTREIVVREQEQQNSKPLNITLFGDATFSLDSLQLIKGKTKAENVSTHIYTPQNKELRTDTWSSIPGTAAEVKTIQQLFEQNKTSAKSFIQTAASEENLKALSGNSPQILHIATHGFFLPPPAKNKNENGFGDGNSYSLAEDPLLRSGLILSGGNYAWSGKTPIEGVEDGIATAYEISQLDLSNTELVVLSACETALGDVKGSEGVFGLQRAFKMAGVKKMIVSLWQVPDKETAELMTLFFTYWMKGKTINEAFAQAQADMRKKYTPFYWAAFVLIE